MKQIIPHFFVEKVSDSVSYFQDVLGFKPIYLQNENDIVNFAILKYGDVQIMVGQKEQLKKIFPDSDDTKKQISALLYFEMNDVDSYYEKIKNKAEIVRELKNTWYKTREFWIRDCNGCMLAFFQNI